MPMPPALITCPTTGDLVPTGAIVSSLEELGDESLLLIACPECGRDHEWNARDAVLAPE
jgi:hypothetical protein